MLDALADLIAAQRQALRRTAVGYFILVMTIAVSLFALERHDRDRLDRAERRDNMNLRSSALRSCRRVNILREQTNQNALVIYTVLHRRAVLNAQAGNREEAKVNDALAASVRHTDPTNCEQAVSNPDGYTPPEPEAFP